MVKSLILNKVTLISSKTLVPNYQTVLCHHLEIISVQSYYIK
jgi:hypothetical protein